MVCLGGTYSAVTIPLKSSKMSSNISIFNSDSFAFFGLEEWVDFHWINYCLVSELYWNSQLWLQVTTLCKKSSSLILYKMSKQISFLSNLFLGQIFWHYPGADSTHVNIPGTNLSYFCYHSDAQTVIISYKRPLTSVHCYWTTKPFIFHPLPP